MPFGRYKNLNVQFSLFLFIYIALLTTYIVSKQRYMNKKVQLSASKTDFWISETVKFGQRI